MRKGHIGRNTDESVDGLHFNRTCALTALYFVTMSVESLGCGFWKKMAISCCKVLSHFSEKTEKIAKT
jgi:hypothetical protein